MHQADFGESGQNRLCKALCVKGSCILIPFKPYPYFHWVLLALCVIFAFLSPDGAYVSFIWFSFAYYYLFNKISLAVVGKNFFIPTRHVKNEEFHIFGLILNVPYLACTFGSTYLLKITAAYINEAILV
jgi:hypothetical protein